MHEEKRYTHTPPPPKRVRCWCRWRDERSQRGGAGQHALGLQAWGGCRLILAPRGAAGITVWQFGERTLVSGHARGWSVSVCIALAPVTMTNKHTQPNSQPWGSLLPLKSPKLYV